MCNSDIRKAIQQEDDATPDYVEFTLLTVYRDEHFLRVKLQPHQKSGVAPKEIEDEWVGAMASWGTGTVGSTGTVRCVDSETGEAEIANVKGPDPLPNQTLQLATPNYIWALKRCWADDEWAKRSASCIDQFNAPKRVYGLPLSTDHLAKLRPAQRQAFSLVNHDPSYLFGPPGTGKTTVLGVILSEYLQANPATRVLVLCTTNRAVDEVAISVDDALTATGQFALRGTINRLGESYDRRKFSNRTHLLPGYQPDPLEDGTSARPAGVRLLALTVNRAIITLDSLRRGPVFDLLVMDEASQISLAHTLAVMPLAKVRLFAGDPIQLSPVSKGNSDLTKQWMAKSAFEYMPPSGPSVCLLNEQSRMPAPICDMVSEVFYEGRLRVAQDALTDRQWLSRSKVRFADISKSQHVTICRIATNATSPPGSRKLRRIESVELILEMIRSAIASHHVSQKDIVVVTAFRMQAKIIQECLRFENIKGVIVDTAHRLFSIKVDTVHRLQGIQAPVIIFDPVDGMHDLLSGVKGRQLINVALSRPQAKLILMLSDRDLQNPTFAQVFEIVERHANRPIEPISRVLSEPAYLTSAIGRRVDIGGRIAEVTQFSRDGGMIWAELEATGVEMCFDTHCLR